MPRPAPARWLGLPAPRTLSPQAAAVPRSSARTYKYTGTAATEVYEVRPRYRSTGTLRPEADAASAASYTAILRRTLSGVTARGALPCR